MNYEEKIKRRKALGNWLDEEHQERQQLQNATNYLNQELDKLRARMFELRNQRQQHLQEYFLLGDELRKHKPPG